MKRSNFFERLALISIFVFVSFSLLGSEQKPYRLLTIETFMEMESVGNPSISPDGKLIIFTRSWVDKMNDQMRSNLWLVDIEGKRVRELTHGNWRDFSPVWSPDGKK